MFDHSVQNAHWAAKVKHFAPIGHQLVFGDGCKYLTYIIDLSPNGHNYIGN
jgi:hypothetical protein